MNVFESNHEREGNGGSREMTRILDSSAQFGTELPQLPPPRGGFQVSLRLNRDRSGRMMHGPDTGTEISES